MSLFSNGSIIITAAPDSGGQGISPVQAKIPAIEDIDHTSTDLTDHNSRRIYPVDNRLSFNAGDIVRRTLSFQRIIAPICHELNNNMAVGRLNLSRLLKMGDNLPPEVATALRGWEEAFSASSQFLSRLQMISEALSFAERASFDVVPVISELLDQERCVAGAGRIVEHYRAPYPFAGDAMPVVVAGNQRLFARSLQHLIKNARDAGADLSQICVSVQPQADQSHQPCAMISMRDNGHGIAPQVMARAVDPFFTTRSLAVSRGLGLSKVCAFVCSAQGSLEISSTPGQGTLVTMRLPLVNHSADAVSASSKLEGEQG